MLTPKMMHADCQAHRAEVLKIVQDHPWMVPATVALHVLPIAIMAHGFWKTRELNKRLKIEQEKTKRLALKQVEHAEGQPMPHHPHHHFHH
ncbi:hypothetical protein [Lactiplantibacillus fabifermentans]|uniref:Transposase n=2 Tax=Lactiplantibacillus fabifermentans TaxID=483011 RepID=W6TAN9_9LACO|nr:hypothetical protein [Lactiplantibacillus fabifermentans]ETY75018.1 transposase [Lactiplantibacillus fabifermentans T30PCM01]